MHYPFKNKLGTHYIDLKKLELIEGAEPDEQENFKKQSPFAFVFRRRDIRVDSATKHHQFSLSGKNDSNPESGVFLHKNHQAEESRSINLSKLLSYNGRLFCSYFLITTQDKVIIWEDDFSIENRLSCFDENLNLLWRQYIVTQIDDQADLKYMMHNDKTIYYWVFKGDIERYELFTWDIQTNTRSNMLYELYHNLCSVLIDDRGNDVGLLEFNASQNSFKVHYGAEQYNLSLPSLRQNYYKKIKIEGILYHTSESRSILWIVYYDPTASGASFYAYDLKKQELLWQSEITSLDVDQSKYWNKICLTLDEDKIIVEGKETDIDYVQIFEATTGKILFSTF